MAFLQTIAGGFRAPGAKARIRPATLLVLFLLIATAVGVAHRALRHPPGRPVAGVGGAAAGNSKGESTIINKEYLDCAYEEGERRTEWPGAIRLVQKPLPSLSMPSGQIVACDPLTRLESPPLDLKVNPGRYPLVLTIAHIGDDQRVAFARLEFTSQRPASWHPIGPQGQDPTTLKEDEYFGYPVDSGTGCFMDPAAAEALWDRMNREESYFEHIIQELDKTYVYTWSWAVITPAPDVSLEVACFSSGDGDGMYPCFVGKDEAGQPVCLLTDFVVFGLASDAP